MVKISDLPIVGKFILILAVFGILSVASVVYSTHEMRRIGESYSAAIDHQALAAVYSGRASRALNQVPLAIEDLVVSTTDEGNRLAMDDLKAGRASFLDFMSKAKALVPEEAQTISDIEDRAAIAADQNCATTMKLGQETAVEAVVAASKEFLATCRPTFRPLTESMKKLTEELVATLQRIDDENTSVTSATILWTYVGVLGGIGFVLILAYFAVTAWISRPLKGLGALMGRLAAGDLSIQVVGAERKDELGPMARAVQVFKDNGAKLRQSEADGAQARDLADKERQRNEGTRADIQREQEAVVSAIAGGLNALSKGDLTGRLNQAFSAEYETLRADFNVTAKSLQDTLGTIYEATNGISAGSDQIAHASDDLARRTEQQAASLEETAAALNLITDTVKGMATNAGQAADIVVSTRASAESSGAIVQQAVEAMSKIQDSSRQIGNIIGVIDEIAFQTNLLALNAGVEAARAGEAGRGFAVVASEVRALAQRSAEAAKEIKELISASTVQVESGVVLVDKTGTALKDIIAKVAEMDALVRGISTASKDQATSIDEINIAVRQMDQVVQQNAAMVEEATAAAHTLKSETQDLASMVGRFQLGDGHGTLRAVPHRGNPVHAVQAKLSRAVKAPSKATAPRPMMKTTSTTPAAADDWQEF